MELLLFGLYVCTTLATLLANFRRQQIEKKNTEILLKKKTKLATLELFL